MCIKQILKDKFLFPIATVIIAMVLFIILGEGSCRLFFGSYLADDFTSEKILPFRHNSEFGWFPIKNSERYFIGTRRILIKNNADGFRDIAHIEKKKPRIMFLGDSFVWGYDVQQEERFTEKLQKMIPAWEMINLGICGYGTDQEYLILKQYFDKYQPNIVFLLLTYTDIGDNSSNIPYGNYFKPYFVIDNGALKMEGVPVPKSRYYYYNKYSFIYYNSYLSRAVLKIYYTFFGPRIVKIPDSTATTKIILQQMKTFVESRGAQFVIGFEENNNELMSFCIQNNIRYMPLINFYRYPIHGYHWSPEGHTWVANKIYNLLNDKDIFITK